MVSGAHRSWRPGGWMEPAVVVVFHTMFFMLFFAPVLRSDRLFISDGLLPAFYAPVQAWTPHWFAGYPVLADPQWQTLYPLRLLFQLLPDGLDFNLFVMAAYVLSASFTSGYVQTLTQSRFAGLISGLVFSLSGFMMAHLGHTSMIHAVVWLPLILWALERLRQGAGWGWLAVGAAAVALQILAGHPQIFIHTLLLVGGYALLPSGPDGGGRLCYAGRAMTMVLLGTGLAAAQWWPTLELAWQSVRANLPFSEFVAFSLPPTQLIQLFFPWLFDLHPALTNLLTEAYQVTYFGEGNRYETTGYVGWLALGLTGVGVMARPRETLVRFWLAVAGLALLLALGDATPLAGLMYHLPGINKFRAPGRHLLEMSLALSILAGYGAAALSAVRIHSVLAGDDRGGEEKPLLLREHLARRAALGLLALLLVLLLAIGAGYGELQALAGGRGVTLPGFFTNGAVWVPALLALMGAAGLWHWCQLSQRRSGPAVLLLALAIDLGSYGWLQDWHRYPFHQSWLQRPPEIARWVARLTDRQQRLAPLAGMYAPLFSPLFSPLYGIPSISGYGPLALQRYHRLLGIAPTGQIDPTVLGPGHRGLDLLATSYVVLAPGAPAPLPEERWRLIETLVGQPIYENRRAMPRTWLVSEVLELPEAAILEAVRGAPLPDGRQFAPERMALVDGLEQRATPALGETVGNPPGTAIITSLGATRLVIHTAAPTPALLVLSQVFYPGWRATVDGTPAPVLRTNYALQGVALPAGAHQVVVAFRSTSQRVGRLITLLSLLLLLALRQPGRCAKSRWF